MRTRVCVYTYVGVCGGGGCLHVSACVCVSLCVCVSKQSLCASVCVYICVSVSLCVSVCVEFKSFGFQDILPLNPSDVLLWSPLFLCGHMAFALPATQHAAFVSGLSFQSL